MASVPSSGPGGVAAAAAATSMPGSGMLCFRDWGRSDCHLRLSWCTHGLPVGRPLLSAKLQLQIDRYLEDGSPWSRQMVCRPIRLSEASDLATMQRARGVVLSDAVMEYYGDVPDDPLAFLGETLARYIRDVAAARAQAEMAPLMTDIYAEARIRMLVAGEEEEEEQGNEEDSEWGEYGELPSPLSAAPAEEAGGSREEEGEGEVCSICLEKMEVAGGDQRQRCWLPCSHSFHADCVGRWLRQKGQCPLCRLQVLRPAV